MDLIKMIKWLGLNELPAEILLNRCRAYGVVYYYRCG